MEYEISPYMEYEISIIRNMSYQQFAFLDSSANFSCQNEHFTSAA